MEKICRLCSSSNYVNNYIFDEETALHVKMTLYMPIKVFKNDRLPQNICDRCSCKVNDLYQFCSEAIDVQKRLQSLLTDDTQSTELCGSRLQEILSGTKGSAELKVKEEPNEIGIQFKEETDSIDNDFISQATDSDSDDKSLLEIRNMKKKKKNTEGKVKKNRVKKSKLDSLYPEEVTDRQLPVIKEESQEEFETRQSEETAFTCCICANIYYQQSAMLRHYKSHESPAEPLPPLPPHPADGRCMRCGRRVPAALWLPHAAAHARSDRRPYRCGHCELSFRHPLQILKHGQQHADRRGSAAHKRFMCDTCPEGFVFMRSLQAHRARAHPEVAAALRPRCAHCGRTFTHQHSLRRHLRAHEADATHLCNVCGKSLSSAEHLKFHIRIHTGYKPHACSVCGKSFVKKCNLTLHERTHSGEKPYACAHCGKAFSQRSTLVIHERYHSGARPYVCTICGRGFVAKGLLTMHLKATCV